MNKVASSIYRIPPLSRVDRARREKQEPSQAEIIVLEEMRKEIAARHQRKDEYINVPDEAPEELAARIEGNRQLDSIGHVGAVLAAICGIAVVAAQFAMWMGW
jgi:hypothetical protein